MRRLSGLPLMVAGIVLISAVHVHYRWLVKHVDVPALGWVAIVSGGAALLVAQFAAARRVRVPHLLGLGPRLMFAGGAFWLALHLPSPPGLDLVSLGLIAGLVGVGLTCAALWRVLPRETIGLALGFRDPDEPPAEYPTQQQYPPPYERQQPPPYPPQYPPQQQYPQQQQHPPRRQPYPPPPAYYPSQGGYRPAQDPPTVQFPPVRPPYPPDDPTVRYR
ncbi:MAG: hypothetical protein ACJ73S_15350 [Mycobacteriales bacterium]